MLEELHRIFPEAHLDILVRKGNESLLNEHPFLREVLIWDKKKGKYRNLLRLSSLIRKRKYDTVLNLQRFAASGFLTWRSKAKERIGFDKNPFSFGYTHKVKHEIGNGKHEVERNLELIKHYGAKDFVQPKLYPTAKQYEKVAPLKTSPFVCMAPSSVWFTKQLPEAKWVELIQQCPKQFRIYLLGAQGDYPLCERIARDSGNNNCEILCGKLSLTESAALMQDAVMNYVNDSGPLHLCSATNAPVTAFFCSTIPEFGFGPLSDKAIIAQSESTLACRPCGLHGYKACPKGHFECGTSISIEKIKPV